MSGKQREGDNPRRRRLAREAREIGRSPSASGATLGASKQFEHLDDKRRSGPPPAGARKPDATRGGPRPAGRAPTRESRPAPDLTPRGAGTRGPGIGYQELVSSVSRRTGIDFADARAAAQATVAALTGVLTEADRERLLTAIPAELHDGQPATGPWYRQPAEAPRYGADLATFLEEVAWISGYPANQARYQAQATLNALAEQDPALIGSLDLPPELHGLLDPLPAGGGVVEPVTGHTPPLGGDELREALTGLRYWSVEDGVLCRTLVLPRANLDRVLDRLDRLRQETGRGPRIGRQDDTTAVITVRTGNRPVGVTSLDVSLAHRVDDAIGEAGAGIAGP